MELIKDGVRNARAIRPLDYENQGAIILAVDSSYIGIGFYIYQEDCDNPKKHHYAAFGSKTLNEREARFSQPKRELFGLKEALKLNKRSLFGVRKLIVETDAKYIKGILENPDMMPTATINRWIDEILMYHFTLRHKAGATFGPDGLSRRTAQADDPVVEPCSDDEEEPVDLPEFEITDKTELQPLSIEEFVDKIDSQRGYFHGIAKSLDDFAEEIETADLNRAREKEHLKNKLAIAKADMSTEHEQYVQQLVNTLTLPLDHDKEKEKPYDEEHRSAGAILQDDLMIHIEKWVKDRSYKPEGFKDKQLERLRRLGNGFLLFEGRIYRRGVDSQHRLYVPKSKQTYMMITGHDHNGHRGFFATKALLTKRFWWPEMERDINQFVKTCHPCQERQSTPTKTHTQSIFEILHADVMHMSPASNGCKYIAHGRDNLTSWPEARALRDEKARSIAMCIYEDILCRWGTLKVIVTDNGSSFIAAAKWIADKWGIKHIHISPYNSQANGSTERPHWDVRQMLYKATGAQNVSKWFWFLDAVLWADRITVRRRTGWSPYYMITGAHPILPLDAEEATWLVKPPNGVINEDELIGMRARSLAKHRIHVKQMRKRIDQDKLRRLKAYEKDYAAVIKDFAFKPGDLVLVRNTEIENSLNKKMKPRYNGPMIVVAENQGKSYIVAEMSGALWHNKVTKFRVVPYFARRRIEIPEGIQKIIDLDEIGLQKLLSAPEDDNLQGHNYLMDDVKMTDSDDNSDQEEEVDELDCIQ